MLHLKHYFICLILVSFSTLADSQVIETRQYADIFPIINDLAHKYGADKTLAVFDIDDTLLVIEHCLKPDGSITRGIGKLYSCPSEHTESDLSYSLAEIQQRGIHTMALTARGNNLIKVTQRELKRVHTGLKPLSFMGKPFNQTFKNVAVERTKRCKKGESPPCLKGSISDKSTFTKGVMYANGSHKGLALKALLKLFKKSYKAIIFIDDRVKNTTHVNQVYGDHDQVEAQIFLYLRHRD